MQILEKDFKQNEITLKIENLNDLWTLYNVIDKGDEAVSLTQRRVVMKEGSPGERKTMRLKLKVEDIAFHEFSNRLRVKGTILEGPDDYVSYGSYHTFNMEPNQTISLIKDEWLRTDLKRLNEASKFESNFKILFIAIETGLATIALVTNYSNNIIATINKSIPGKRYEQSFRKKFVKDFFEDIQRVIEMNVERNDIDLIAVCGPGDTRNQLINHLRENTNKQYVEKLKSVHATSGTESAIHEALRSPELEHFKENAKVLRETEMIDEFMAIMSQDPDLVAIGVKGVSQAAEYGAVEHLLVADVSIRGVSKEQKLIIEDIIRNVEKTGGKVDIMSSEQSPGKQLVDLGSIIAILRYKL